ncbi:MAG: TonB-dependent receptor [Saprospiraceae bacterium]|nr:TonB-dependent receptor [Saprospiraceae bacterium]
MRFYILLFLLSYSQFLFAQDQRSVLISGQITDLESKEPIEFANIFIEGTTKSTQSDIEGKFQLYAAAETKATLVISRIGFKEVRIPIEEETPGSRRILDVKMVQSTSTLEVIITDTRMDHQGMIRQNVESLKYIPTTTGNLESVLPHIALGVSSGTGGELSSQYNVRGGNYDENLIYVNDFEIYRPQLIRSGQQEGLTFPNMDLVRDLSFSSGGFQARYGDKQSSVLDVRYKRPEKFGGSVSGSFLGGSAHVEGALDLDDGKYRKFRYLVGARYKTTQYLLSSLDVKGEYVPDFSDIQGYFTYDINRDFQLAFMGNFNRSKFSFKPTFGNIAKGLIDFTLNLRTSFEGQEIDDFTSTFGGLSLTWLPDRKRNPIFMKLLLSTYQSNENERIDIIGNYDLLQIETSLGAENAGEVIAVLGSGVQHTYVRNYLQANVTNLEWKGGIELQSSNNTPSRQISNFIQWGTKLQHEWIDDRINEWERLDSALYSVPNNDDSLFVNKVYKAENELQSGRVMAFAQNTYTWMREDAGELQLTYGLRANYWTLNKEWIIAPRAQISYKPFNSKKDIIYRLSGGIYHQPPFYRELRNPQGEVNENARSQKSAQILAGMTWDFTTGRNNQVKYRLIGEVYYKHLWDLISYDVDNVRIRYSGQNDAKGYVTGIDLRLNGEFLPGAESWFNISYLRARESIEGVQHLARNPGEREGKPVETVPRPTDQAILFTIFFQDFLPRNEKFKVHVNFTFGTGLPFGLPEANDVYRNTFRFSPYRRIDIGFSYALWDASWLERRPKHILRHFKNGWISVEVFNLMQMANVANNTWVKSIYNVQYAIPNYLTSRRINLRFRLEF